MSIPQTRIVIESVSPELDAGRYDVKAARGDRIDVSADIYRDGHELLAAAVWWRRVAPDEPLARGEPRRPDLDRPDWHEVRMVTAYETNDRWFASFPVDEVGRYAFTVVGWTDRFRSWRTELEKRVAARQPLGAQLGEALALVDRALGRAAAVDRRDLGAIGDALRMASDEDRWVEIALSARLGELMDRCDPRSDRQAYARELPLWVDRERARYGAWYELFPRSQGTDPSRSATFREAATRLAEIAVMRFDVLYLPPIHPIGRTHRKGANNTENALPGEPGSPWAIGAVEGGHTAVHPDLGTLADFDFFCAAAARRGLEIALDFAVQCSPDHPWVSEHPEWFAKRADGSIRYAENPPKKYQDIYPIDFETADRDGLYQALLEVVRFWIGHGVKIFRVDNPHTKPVSFWEWLIDSVHREHPDVVFLAEAFTRPKRMKLLAKVGFSQSYTYFTWRNGRRELEEYCEELFGTEVRHYLRPNFFANTPDILHQVLQDGGRPAFLMRLVLAATLSPSYGIYSGFELCENQAVRPGSEEYLASEKYQYKVRDWHRAGNIREAITLVNGIRRNHRALQLAENLVFLASTNPSIIAYLKATADGTDALIVVVNVDPFHAEEGMVRVPPELFEQAQGDEVPVTDLLTGERYRWHWQHNYVRLDPHHWPAHVLRIERALRPRLSPAEEVLREAQRRGATG